MVFVRRLNSVSAYAIRWFIFASVVLMSTNGSATVPFGDSERELASLSGMSEQIELIPLSTVSAFENILDADQLPAMFRTLNENDLRNALSTAFTAEKFNRQLLSQLRNQLDGQDRAQLIRWYQSPLGHRIKQAELEYSLLTSGTEFAAFQQALELSAIDTPRLKLIQQLDDTMQTTMSAVDMMASMQVAFNVSLSPALPSEQRLSIEQVLAMAEQQKPELYLAYRAQSQALLLFMYEQFSNAELLALDKELSSGAGQRFISAVNLSIQNALFSASQELGQRLGAMLEDVVPQGVGI